MSIDDRIRAALKDADDKGKLAIVAVITGIPEPRLRELMTAPGAIPTMEQTILGSQLGP